MEGGRDQCASAADAIFPCCASRWLSDLLRFLVLPFVHAFFSGLVLGLALTTLKSLCARGPYGALAPDAFS